MEAVITAIISRVDWTAVFVGIGVVAAALAGIFVIYRGAVMLIGMIRGDSSESPADSLKDGGFDFSEPTRPAASSQSYRSDDDFDPDAYHESRMRR